jgi:hypothetical protein
MTMPSTGKLVLVGLIAVSAGAGLAAALGGEAAIQVAPVNTTAPAITGNEAVGEILNASTGTWTGTAPISYAYQWQRCNAAGANCATIVGATQQSYTASVQDEKLTLRVQVTATNADGSASALSAVSDVVQQQQVNITGCPPVQEAGPLQLDEVKPPARLLIDRTERTPAVITRSTQRITLRFHVVACDSREVQGVLVYATATPYQQFDDVERPTRADGWATLMMNRLRFFPASSRQQLLVVFARARKPGSREELLEGVSSRRLVSFPVNLNG